MNITRRLVLAVVVMTFAWNVSPTRSWAQQPEQQGEFVPLDQLPPQEVYPAAPLVIGAYVFVPVVLFLYLLSLSRRMTAVQREVERLEAELRRTSRG